MGEKKKTTRGITHADDSRVFGHCRRVVLLDAGSILNSQVLHVAATEYDILVDLVGRRNLLFGTAFAAFRTEGANILQGHCRLFRVDLVQDADVSRDGVSKEQMAASCFTRWR